MQNCSVFYKATKICKELGKNASLNMYGPFSPETFKLTYASLSICLSFYKKFSLDRYIYSPGEASLDTLTSISVTAYEAVSHSKCKE